MAGTITWAQILERTRRALATYRIHGLASIPESHVIAKAAKDLHLAATVMTWTLPSDRLQSRRSHPPSG
ncbi:hypothetical protein L596_029383 [Steinernema carpocapsae]|uniref:Uncharacterized protein n=1 Tax=Steinernema carpocapsae TaxID=34508 RepID=A0A4U5LUH1_STECR|nr:hypothetical protein L596_029383 [Steinernema carpocapsae]